MLNSAQESPMHRVGSAWPHPPVLAHTRVHGLRTDSCQDCPWQGSGGSLGAAPGSVGEMQEGQSHRGSLVVSPGRMGGPKNALEMELRALTVCGTAGLKRGGGLTCAPHLWSGLPQEGLLISFFDGKASEPRRGFQVHLVDAGGVNEDSAHMIRL